MQDCQGGKAGSVRRQGSWDQFLLKLGESLAALPFVDSSIFARVFLWFRSFC